MPFLASHQKEPGLGRKTETIACGAAAALAAMVLLALGVASLFIQALFDPATFSETAILTRRNPFAALLGSALLGIAALGIVGLLMRGAGETARWRRAGALAVGAAVLVTVLSAAWAISLRSAPVDDPDFVWQMAICLAKDTPEALDLDYLTTYPHQCGMAMLFELFIRLFGTNPVPGFGVFSAICAGVCVLGLCAVCRELSDDPRAVAVCALLCLLFAPLALYSAYVYGTLAAPAMTFWGLYGVLRLCKGGNKGFWALPMILLPLAVTIYNGALIFGVAAFLALLFCAVGQGKKELLRMALPAVLLLALCFGTEPAAQAVFCARTGTYAYEGMPKTSWVAMGISATENTASGPGSYDGSSRALFWQNKADVKAADAVARASIAQAVEGYREDPASGVSFFGQKTAYQWLDPWFGALTMSYDPEINDPGPFAALLCDGPLLSPVQRMVAGIMHLGYLAAALGTVVLARRRRGSVWAQIMGIAFLGGFLFQLVWESKSRYCFPYFLALLPLAAIGLSALAEKLPKKMR